YWVRHLREPVRFAQGMATLQDLGCRLFVEIGPKPVLIGMGRRCLPQVQIQSWLPSLHPDRDDRTQMLESLAALHVAGAPITWSAVYPQAHAYRLHLPTYAFQRRRYWMETPSQAPVHDRPQNILHPLLHRQLRVAGADRVFETELSSRTIPYLVDHALHGAAVLPVPALIEMARAAARSLWGDRNHDVENTVENIGVEDLLLRRPLSVTREAVQTVQLLLTPETDGSATFRLFSFQTDIAGDSGADTGEDWLLHSTGRVRRNQTPVAQTVNPAEVQARCPAYLTGGDYYAQLHARGIEIGPHLQSIEQLWRQPGEALGRVQLSTQDKTPYLTHPALLDGCLQLLGAALPDGEAGAAYIPISLERVWLADAFGAQVWCHVLMRPSATAAPEVQSADLRIYDQEGKSIGAFTGLVMRRAAGDTAATGVALPTDWLYELAWQPMPEAAAAHLPAPAELIPALISQAQASQIGAATRLCRAVLPQFEALSTAYTLAAFEQLGLRFEPGTLLTEADLVTSLGVVDSHRRMLLRMVALLVEDNILARRGAGWEVRRTPTRPDAGAILAELVAEAPECEPELALAARCGRHLAAVLQGRHDPIALLFPGGSVTETARIYRDSPFVRRHNALVRAAVEQAAARLTPGQTLRILEIGAGTGGTTASILPVLPAQQTEYTFTDVSPLFTQAAQETFAAYPFVRFTPLDIEQSPAGQGFAPHQYDLIVAANVLHATRDLRRTLAHVRDLLVPSGLLVLVEGTQAQRYKDLMVGLTEGWWAFTDTDLRPNYALIDQAAWLTLLQETGFVNTVATPGEEQDAATSSQDTVFLAQAPQTGSTGPTVARNWLILADQSGVGAQLADRLQRAGCAVTMALCGADDGQDAPGSVTINPARPDDFQRLLSAVTTAPGRLGVVHLWSLDAETPDDGATKTITETITAGQQNDAGSMLHLLHAVPAQSDSRLWLVTRLAQAVSAEQRHYHPAAATLWGLGRVMALEQPERWGGLVDLDNSPAADAAGQIFAELCRFDPDGEDQVAWRAGIRYAARLLRTPTLDAPPLRWRSEGSYLISGGLGGLGLKLAQRLAQQGVRHLVLTSRTGLPDRSQWSALPLDSEAARRAREVQAIESLGATVEIAAVDVGDAAGMAALLARFGRDLPDLRGVFHTAAEAQSRALAELSPAEFQAMFKAKGTGAWLLHRLTADRDLDCFVLFSSTTGLLGVSSMGAYAAANCFLDTLAHQRRAQGLPALSVNWGVWEEMRGLSDVERADALRFGLRPMSADRALALLERLVATQAAQQVVADVDWTRLAAAYETRRKRPLLAQVATAQPAPAKRDALVAVEHSLQARLAALARPDARHELLLDYVRGVVAQVIGLRDPDRIDVTRGLFEMGMDSLMAVELRSRLETGVAHPLPTTLTFNYPTVAALAGYLATHVFGDADMAPNGHASAAVPTAVQPAADAVDAASALDALDADALLNLLDDELAAADSWIKGD
ncbi:MAG: SDR family NAD(P)-dependent oxidoreductase, partial [Caldilineaceae bacterium]|nr:SDR family NAD(P)-dependent oxidoreductase [Caldilineaceae bacterium]